MHVYDDEANHDVDSGCATASTTLKEFTSSAVDVNAKYSLSYSPLRSSDAHMEKHFEEDVSNNFNNNNNNNEKVRESCFAVPSFKEYVSDVWYLKKAAFTG